jgi:hypothetical protein
VLDREGHPLLEDTVNVDEGCHTGCDVGDVTGYIEPSSGILLVVEPITVDCEVGRVEYRVATIPTARARRPGS